jgi:hypothetical protein
MKTARRVAGQRYQLYGNSAHAPYSADLTGWEWRTQKRREKTSKRKRGLPGWKRGAASEVRVLTGAEFESRKRELESLDRNGRVTSECATIPVASRSISEP